MIRLILLKIVTLTTIITFLWSGLTINFLQLLNYLIIRRVNFQLFTKINYYLMYSAWSQIVTLFDWFFKTDYKVYHKDKHQEADIFKGHSIFLANHGFELDWVGAWLVTDKFGAMAACKAMLKSDLKYIPVVGWSWALSDQLFLDRNWEKDKHKFSDSIDILLKYDPLIATFFCEGKRFTSDNYEASKKFAQERNLIAPKYHLIPRTKGFVTVMKEIKLRKKTKYPNLNVYIYNTQVAYDDAGAMNISDIIQHGKKPMGHLYFERYTLDDIPDDDVECAKWLHDLFVEKKDSLYEYFLKNKCFPGHVDKRFVNYKPRLATISNWLFWTLYTMLALLYLINRLYLAYGTFLVSIVMSTFFIVSYLYLNYIIFQADVTDGKKVKQT